MLGLPEKILESLKFGKLSEGHARTLLMLNDRPEEQEVIFREILLKKMSVREVERIVRKIATDKVRKKSNLDLDAYLIDYEKQFTETLGTRVQIQKTDFGGKLTIDYFSVEDLEGMLERMKKEAAKELPQEHDMIEHLAQHTPLESPQEAVTPQAVAPTENHYSAQPQPEPQTQSEQRPHAEPEPAEQPPVAHEESPSRYEHPGNLPTVQPTHSIPPAQGHYRYQHPQAMPVSPRMSSFLPNQLAAQDSYDDVFQVDKSPVVEKPDPTPVVQPPEPADDSDLYSIKSFNV